MILSLNGGPGDGRTYEARHSPEVIEVTTVSLLDEPSARANANRKALYRRKEFPKSVAASHRVEYSFTGVHKDD